MLPMVGTSDRHHTHTHTHAHTRHTNFLSFFSAFVRFVLRVKCIYNNTSSESTQHINKRLRKAFLVRLPFQKTNGNYVSLFLHGFRVDRTECYYIVCVCVCAFFIPSIDSFDPCVVFDCIADVLRATQSYKSGCARGGWVCMCYDATSSFRSAKFLSTENDLPMKKRFSSSK